MNKTILTGRLTKDVEIKKTPNGASVVSFTLAVNRIGKKQEGQPESDFIQCVAWNNTADLMAQYLGKGSLIGVEGRIQTRNYENSEGRRVYVTEVVVERVEFLESRSQREQQQQKGYYDQTPNNDYDQYQQTSDDDFDEEPMLNIASEDLPF